MYLCTHTGDRGNQITQYDRHFLSSMGSIDINNHNKDDISNSKSMNSTTTRSTSPIDDRIIRIVLGDTRDLNNDLDSIKIPDTQARTPGKVPAEGQVQPIENIMASMAKMMEAISNLVSNNTKKSFNLTKKCNTSNSFITTTNKKISKNLADDNFSREMKNYKDITVHNEIQSIRKHLKEPGSANFKNSNISKKINFNDDDYDNVYTKNQNFQEKNDKINNKSFSVKSSKSEIMDLLLSKIQVMLS
jgi:hypothetical protein